MEVDDQTDAPHHEPLSSAPIYNSQLQNGLGEVKNLLGEIANTMCLSGLTDDPNTSLHKLHNETKKASEFRYPETRTVGLIGDSGVGKSSVINSLLDQANLARSSRDGSACTCVVTEFRHSGNDHDAFTIEAEFMNSDEVKELLEELLQSVRQFHTDSLYQQLRSAEEQASCREKSDRAWEALESLFNNEPEMSLEYVSRDEEGAELAILNQLERWALLGSAHRPGGPNSLEYTAVCTCLDECKQQLDTLTADSPEGNRPALWPFIKLIKVYLDAPILRTGLVLADLPGLRDMNYARVRATEQYLNHKCDEVFIVTNIARCITDQSIPDIISRCRESQPRRIICTRSEDVSPEETARGQSRIALRVREMNQGIEQIREQQRDASIRKQRAVGPERTQIILEEETLRERMKALNLERTHLLVQERNTRITRELATKYLNERVFCVSNSLYGEYRDDPQEHAEAYLQLSGVRQLRSYCQLVPADAQLRATSAFLQHQVPAHLMSLRQWALSGADSVTVEKAATLRRVLGDVEAALRQNYMSREAPLPTTQGSVNRLFDQDILNSIRNRDSAWTAHSVRVSEEWRAWHHMTYAAWCRNYGTYRTKAQAHCCWNDALIQKPRDCLSPVWDQIIDYLESSVRTLVSETSRTFRRMQRVLAEHQNLAPQALGNLLTGLEARQKCIADEIHDAFANIVHHMCLIRRDVLFGHASSVMTGLMRSAYISCNRASGTGSDRIRKDTICDHLTHSRLFANYLRINRQMYQSATVASFDALEQKVHEQVQMAIRDVQAVVAADGEAPEAEQAPALAEAMGRQVSCALESVARVQAVLEGLVSQ
ncbi:hypothetical protein BDW42DRAFT_170368 [Aspergillus taichungensis]|uniref:P-loop containing nucleoside triphosphate hydrolase protein n=1 Tax=Aspergillus taichungensis TaxID=482145 RepID=A0A2J5HTX0_9EURO|nr:hypothetical protein BDW42DRAFT_170368 [Aspergillus taichungensis]